MKFKIFVAVLCSTIIIAVSCKNENTEPAEIGGVFIAGYQTDSTTSRQESTVWKNGVPTINQLSGGNSHFALAIAVSGNDIYTTGYENRGTNLPGQVWKNGQHQYSLGDAYSNYGQGIAVSGTNVIVAGRAYDNSPIYSYAIVWRNNSATNNNNNDASILATTANSASTGCYAVAISGTDEYVVGNENTEARLWKNGVSQPLANPPSSSTSVTVVGVAVEGSDVYVVGYINGDSFRIWKNGSPTDYSTNGEGYPSSIAVSGTDVYVGGYEKINGKWVATYWKNGTPVRLGDPARNSFVRGMALKGSDVYAVGEQRDANDIFEYAALWKNNALTLIGKRRSRATAIVVK